MTACPYSALMPGSMESRKWTVNELVSSIKCFICKHDVINTWSPCSRQSASINCHPNFTSRTRQLWFILMQFLKYIKPSDSDIWATYAFEGEHEVEHEVYSPLSESRRKLNSEIPKGSQIATIIRRGKFMFLQKHCFGLYSALRVFRSFFAFSFSGSQCLLWCHKNLTFYFIPILTHPCIL